MVNLSTRALSIAMNDTLLQADQQTHARLSNRLRDELAEMRRIERGIAKLAKELLVIQRRMAATADLIAIEETRRAA